MTVRNNSKVYCISGAAPASICRAYDKVKEACPPWWGTSLPAIMEGMCNMFARGTYTAESIAEWWECPVEFVRCVENVMARRIRTLKRELDEVTEIYLSALAAAADENAPGAVLPDLQSGETVVLKADPDEDIVMQAVRRFMLYAG